MHALQALRSIDKPYSTAQFRNDAIYGFLRENNAIQLELLPQEANTERIDHRSQFVANLARQCPLAFIADFFLYFRELFRDPLAQKLATKMAMTFVVVFVCVTEDRKGRINFLAIDSLVCNWAIDFA
jgi:hypothetical protein